MLLGFLPKFTVEPSAVKPKSLPDASVLAPFESQTLLSLNAPN